jgi:hypothetical protein
MSTPQDVAKILHAYVKRNKNPRVNFSQLLSFTERLAEKHLDEHPEYGDLVENGRNTLVVRLMELERQGGCSLEHQGGQIASVFFPQYFVEVVRRAYRIVDQRSEVPFPSEETLDVEIPGDIVSAIDIKQDLVNWIRKSEREQNALLRLLFPDGIASMILPSDLLAGKLVELCIQKVRRYLRTSKNASYMQSKLSPLFRNREVALKDLINAAMTLPDQARRGITEPSESSFQFWTQLSSNIIKEFVAKKERSEDDHSYAQSSYILGYYCVYYKAQEQRKRDVESAFKLLETKLHKEPFVYTGGEILGFADEKGVPLTKKYSTQELNAHLKELTSGEESESLPEIVRLRAPDQKDYYMPRERIIQVFMTRKNALSTELKRYYKNAFYQALREDEKLSSMTTDELFERSVHDRTKERDPLFYGMLNYELLYLSASAANLSQSAAEEVNRIFHGRTDKLIPLPDLLELERRELVADAKLRLPFWQAIPLLRFFWRLFRGKKRSRKSDAPREEPTQKVFGERGTTASAGASSSAGSGPAGGAAGGSDGSAGGQARGKADSAAFKRRIRELQREYVGEGGSVDMTLSELAEKWNPLLDQTAKNNLIEDVNALVRDFLRRMRTGFRKTPPDRERIQSLASQLAQNDAFDKIKRREYLRRYLELYMLKLLGK